MLITVNSLSYAKAMRHNQECRLFVFVERLHPLKVSADDLFHIRCHAASQSGPHHLRGTSKHKTPLMKVGIFRHDHKSLLFGVVPDERIICLFQSDLTDMRGVRKEVRELMYKFVRQPSVSIMMGHFACVKLKSRVRRITRHDVLINRPLFRKTEVI